MLKELLNQRVKVGVADYAHALRTRTSVLFYIEGIITNIDDRFIQLDNNILIAINYITYIEKI